MPKLKTDKGAKKRFKITGSGKILKGHANRSHLLEKKPSKRTRRLSKQGQVAKGDLKEVRRLLGI
jgi:large subunit ribosomal protein L35